MTWFNSWRAGVSAKPQYMLCAELYFQRVKSEMLMVDSTHVATLMNRITHALLIYQFTPVEHYKQGINWWDDCGSKSLATYEVVTNHLFLRIRIISCLPTAL